MARPDPLLRPAYEPPETAGVDEPPTGGRRGRAPAPEPVTILGLDRRTLTLFAVAIVAGWLVFVFGRAVADSQAVNSRAEQLRIENASVAQELAARTAELTTVQSPAFIALQARTFGIGTPREQVFALQPGAPAAPKIEPLGDEPPATGGAGPLEAWLDLLFGP